MTDDRPAPSVGVRPGLAASPPDPVDAPPPDPAALAPLDPLGPLTAYVQRAVVLGLVVAGALAWWWSRRRGQRWGAPVAAVLAGVGAALVVALSLRRTPYAPGGLVADQTFRTAAITRFADDWRLADFTFADLPAFYAPGYFWVLGRLADLTGTEPWRWSKYGTIAVTLLVPVVAYLLWRRLVPAGTAALIGVVPLAVQDVWEPYAWLVLSALVPWWLETVAGVRRPGRPPGHPVFLGLVGAALFLTYYYFFFLAAIALVVYLAAEAVAGRWRWRRVGHTALVLGIAAVGSAVYWLPLLVTLLRTDGVRSLANRWFSDSHPNLPLPMTGASVTALVALAGLVYLVWTMRREALSRGLLALLVAGYAWWLLGAAAAVVDTPLLSFRGKPLVTVVLLSAGVVALVRLTMVAATRFSAADVRRTAWVLAGVLVLAAGQGFVSAVRDHPLVVRAHSTALPDGSLPPFHRPDEITVPDPPAETLRQVVDGLWAGREGRPVVLSTRDDLLALYPYPGWLQWNAHYAHPASRFDQRVAWLRGLAAADDPARLAEGLRDTPFGPVDVLVLRVEGDAAVLRYAADNFPKGIRGEQIRFPLSLFASGDLRTVRTGDHLVVAVD